LKKITAIKLQIAELTKNAIAKIDLEAGPDNALFRNLVLTHFRPDLNTEVKPNFQNFVSCKDCKFGEIEYITGYNGTGIFGLYVCAIDITNPVCVDPGALRLCKTFLPILASNH
jgi:hypothetical protein